MGNNSQKSSKDGAAAQKRYNVSESDEEESSKRLASAKEFLSLENYEKANQLFQDSLQFNPLNQEALREYIQLQRRQGNKLELFCLKLRLEYILAGYGHSIGDQMNAVQNGSSNRIVTSVVYTTENDFGSTAEDRLQMPKRTPIDLQKKYFLANKAYLEVLPMEREQFREMIEQLQESNKFSFEVMFFIEKFFDKYQEYNSQDVSTIIQIYTQYNLESKITQLQAKSREIITQQENFKQAQ